MIELTVSVSHGEAKQECEPELREAGRHEE